MIEEWEKIIINDQQTYYSVSNLGRIRNDSTGTFLEGSIWNNGYKMVHLRYRLDKMCSVHRLVMKAFKPCPDMDELQINHIDGNKLNNHLDNLEWCTALENMRHSYINGLQKNQMKKVYVYDKEGNFIKEYINAQEAIKDLHIDSGNQPHFYKCLKGEGILCKDYQPRYEKFDKIPAWSDPKTKKVYVYDKETSEFLKAYNSYQECAIDIGVSSSSISRYVNGQRKHSSLVFLSTPL